MLNDFPRNVVGTRPDHPLLDHVEPAEPAHIVRSVDEILQKEFGLEDGLADTATWGDMHAKNPEIKIPEDVSDDEPFVQILDPATGTGTFLVETIGLIEKRMKDKWREEEKSERDIEALWNEYVPQHLLPRLNGFELMMAPYAIAHIKIGMKLAETGYEPKNDNQERVRVYLTNISPAIAISIALHLGAFVMHFFVLFVT